MVTAANNVYKDFPTQSGKHDKLFCIGPEPM